MIPRHVAAALVVALAAAAPARAHALGAEAKFRAGRVEVEAYFSDDTPARDARVIVHDHAGAVVAEGRTDDQGKWQFPAPQPGPYTVVVDAGAGHRTRPIHVTVPAVLPAGPTGPVADGVTISDGPGRAEFTRFPWGGLAAGLAIITLLAVGWRALRRARTARPATPPAARTP